MPEPLTVKHENEDLGKHRQLNRQQLQDDDVPKEHWARVKGRVEHLGQGRGRGALSQTVKPELSYFLPVNSGVFSRY